MNRQNVFIKMAILLIAFLIFIGVGYWLNQEPSAWYENLQKPFFTPPNWLFGPVWTILYLLMIVAIVKVWNAPPVEDPNLKK